MAKLSVNVAGVAMKNPVLLASGCCGFGREYDAFYPVERLGGLCLKGTTPEPRQGNAPSRIAETPSGMLNCVGLQNPGVEALVLHELPALRGRDTVIIPNLSGSSVEDYCHAVERVCETDVPMIELNISCPNVKSGGAAFGVSCAGAAQVVREVRRVCTKKLMVKLSPNVTDIAEIARAVEAEGADAVSLINTPLGMRIDVKTRRPILHNNVGGLSGPAVFPIALRMVWQVANAVRIPVVGLGGITTWQDAAEMMLAGASAVQVGAALFADAYAPLKIIEGLEQWLDENGIPAISEIVGTVQPWEN